MLPKRMAHDEETVEQAGTMAAVETARSATESSSKGAEPKKDEEHVSIFWRLFGGTILSIVALVSITLYNNISSSISELRAEVSREREARAEHVKKDEFNSRNTSLYERLRGIDAIKVELEGLKEKSSANAAALEGAKKDTATAINTAKKDTTAVIDALKKDTTAAIDAMKKDSAAIEVLKERVAGLEMVKKDIAGLDALKEKLTGAAADLKVLRDELSKVSVSVERNKTADLERKTTRDTQYKQIDETLKEVQKGLQDCREKLARLEGKGAPLESPARPNPMTKPPASGTGKTDEK